MPPEEIPHLWQKPAAEELLQCLEKLEVKPPVWGFKVSRADVLREQSAGAEDRHEISRFLSSIISSNLTWIDNDDQREELWNLASKRLAERCGRTGELRHNRYGEWVHFIDARYSYGRAHQIIPIPTGGWYWF